MWMTLCAGIVFSLYHALLRTTAACFEAAVLRRDRGRHRGPGSYAAIRLINDPQENTSQLLPGYINSYTLTRH